MNQCKRVGFVCLLVLTWGLGTSRPSMAQPPGNLDNVVVFAKDQVRLSRNARHVSGQIVVDDPLGTAIVHPQFRAVPDLAPQLIVNRLETLEFVGASGPDFFDLFTNSIDDPNMALHVNGTLTMPLGFTLPLFPYPDPPTIVPGTTLVRVRRSNSPVTLPPGDYGIVRVGAEGVLYLEGGVYNFKQLRVGFRGQLVANGTTTINVLERVRFLGRTNFGAADPEFPGRCVVLNTASTKNISFGRLADVTAIVNAPAASLRLGKLGSFRGNFTARRVTVGRSAVLETLPPLTEACP